MRERGNKRERERKKGKKEGRKKDKKRGMNLRYLDRILLYNPIIMKNNVSRWYKLPIEFNSNPNSLMLDNVSRRFRDKDPGYEKRFSCLLFFLMALIYINLNITQISC